MEAQAFIRKRIDKLRKTMIHLGMGAVILEKPENVMYFTGFNPVLTLPGWKSALPGSSKGWSASWNATICGFADSTPKGRWSGAMPMLLRLFH